MSAKLKMLDLDFPEYFVTHIGKAEQLSGGCVRFIMCTQRGSTLVPVYASIWPRECVLSRGELQSVINNAMVWPDGAMH